MDDAIAREYRRLRALHPDTLSARTALVWARSEREPTKFDWGGKPGNHVARAKTTADGFDIVVTVDYDEYAERRAEPTDEDTGIRNPGFRWEGDASETSYRHRNDPSKGCRYIKLESDATVRELADDYNQMGMARHIAWNVGRQSLEEEAYGYLADDYTEYVVGVAASRNGIELGSSPTLGGIESTWETAERDFEDVVVENGLIEEAVDEARKALAGLVRTGA